MGTTTQEDLVSLEQTIQSLGDHPLDATIDMLALTQTPGNASLGLGKLPTLEASEDAPDDADLKLLNVLGEGGMGVVFRARQQCLQREVAVKTLRDPIPHPKLFDHAQKLLEESVLTGQLEHPNIIPVHVLGRSPQGKPLLVMKRVEGESWRALIADPASDFWPERGDARLTRHLEVLIQVCNAVAFAHSRGIIHRDIKPANVMVGHFGEVYLLDWGVAAPKALLAASDERPLLLGTPAYMAPELALGQQRWVTERSDIYLLGATLFEVLTGHPPHQGPNLMATLLQAHSTESLVIDAALVPDALQKIVADATARAPEARFQTVNAFRDAISDYLRHQGASQLATQALEALEQTAQALPEPLKRAPDPTRDATERALQDQTTRALLRLHIALEQWPQNERARAGLQHHLERMLRRALSSGHAEQASALVVQLPYPNAALQEEVAALLAEQRRDLDARASLRALRRDQSLSVNYRLRLLVYGVFIAFGIAINAVFIYRYDGDMSRYGHAETTIGASIVVLIFALFGLVFRRRVMDNAINRRLTLGFGSAMGGMIINRLFAWSTQAPLPYMHAIDLLIFGMMQIAFAPGLHPLLILSGAICVLAAALSAFFPATAGFAFGIATLVSPLILLWALEKTRAKEV